MIENELQYQVTKEQLGCLQETLREVCTSSLQPEILQQAEEDGLRAMIAELQEQLEQYEARREHTT
jgi:hypothetical protein